MRVLVTNDDGIEAPGLHVLAAALVDAGHDVIVAAPAEDCSGQGAAVGPLHLTGKVVFDRRKIEGIAAEAFAVDGTPALAVMAACLGGFGPAPSVVVSGINAGANTGRAVLHSGTVGAALTAANMRVPAMAVSQAAAERYQWGTAASIAVELVSYVAELSPTVALNLNVPNVALADIRGLAPAGLDAGGTVQAAMVERSKSELELRFSGKHQPAPGTDVALLEAGYATLTALIGPRSVGVDMKDLCRNVERTLTKLSSRRIPA